LDNIILNDYDKVKITETEELETIMKRTALYMSVTVITLLLAMSCSSDKYSISSKNMAEDRDAYDIEATLVYMTDEALLEQFGPHDNPYLSPKKFTGTSEILAFKVTVQNNTPDQRAVTIPLESIRMVAGNSAFVPQSSYQLYNYWDNFLKKRRDKDRRYFNTSSGKMRFVINETLFANPATVKSGESYSGFVAFMGRFSKYGYGEIHIPVFDENEKVIGIFTQEFERE
jgi:hypothetical protein